MEDKKYEAGKVVISSEEYRDLVKEATENRLEASQARSDRWKMESERNKLSQELESANKKIEELQNIICNLQARLAVVNCNTFSKENI